MSEALVQLVTNTDDPAKTLELIDSYIELKKRTKSAFVLPDEHEYLRSVIEYLEDDVRVFRAFVILVRDLCKDSSHEYASVQAFQRKLASREAAQNVRRYLQIAHEYAKINMPDRDFTERSRWLERLAQSWKAERRALLAEAKHRKGAPITLDEKDQIIETFWETISTRVAFGKLPSWEDLMK